MMMNRTDRTQKKRQLLMMHSFQQSTNKQSHTPWSGYTRTMVTAVLTGVTVARMEHDVAIVRDAFNVRVQ